MDAEKISEIQRELRQLNAEIALLKAQSMRQAHATSPWLTLKEASKRLNYKSDRSLRSQIQKGHFPPDCVRIDPASPELQKRYLVNVERYIKLLR